VWSGVERICVYVISISARKFIYMIRVLCVCVCVCGMYVWHLYEHNKNIFLR